MNTKIGKTVSIASFNCQGLQNKDKRYDINYLKNTGAKVIYLQDIHLTNSDLHWIKTIWKGEIFLNGCKTNARDVAVLISKKVSHYESNATGNMLLLDMIISDEKIQLIGIYGPNTDDYSFFNKISNLLQDHEQDYAIWCGDFNITLNPDLDSYNFVNVNNSKSRNTLLNIIHDYNLVNM